MRTYSKDKKKFIRIRDFYGKVKISILEFILLYLPLLILLFLAIISGFFFSDIFLGLGSDFFSDSIYINPLQNQIFFEKHFEIFFFKFIPIICSFFFFFFRSN